jgi:ornithine cyclodeaminase
MVQQFDRIRCWSPTETRLQSFVAAHPEASPAANAQQAVRDADVVVLATAATTPVVWNDWIAPGACVISVGACRPTQREMDGRLVARGRLLTDSRAAALKESGDILIAIAEGHFGPEHLVGELGEVLAGRLPGRTTNEEVVIFKPLGQAVEDVSAAQLAYNRACAMGRGVPLA